MDEYARFLGMGLLQLQDLLVGLVLVLTLLTEESPVLPREVPGDSCRAWKLQYQPCKGSAVLDDSKGDEASDRHLSDAVTLRGFTSWLCDSMQGVQHPDLSSFSSECKL